MQITEKSDRTNEKHMTAGHFWFLVEEANEPAAAWAECIKKSKHLGERMNVMKYNCTYKYINIFISFTIFVNMIIVMCLRLCVCVCACEDKDREWNGDAFTHHHHRTHLYNNQFHVSLVSFSPHKFVKNQKNERKIRNSCYQRENLFKKLHQQQRKCRIIIDLIHFSCVYSIQATWYCLSKKPHIYCRIKNYHWRKSKLEKF